MTTSPLPRPPPAMPNAAAVWDKHALAYEQIWERSTSLWGRDALVLGQLPPTDVSPAPKLLDVACGTGAFAMAAAALGFDVTATDFSAGMVAQLEKKLVASTSTSLASAGLKVTTRVVDGQTLEGLEDASFDVVSSVFGAFMFPDRASAWRSAWRVLKPGGRLLATSWDINSVNLRMAQYVSEASHDNANVANDRLKKMLETNRMFRAVSFREELEEFGFQDVTIHSTSHPMCFRSGQEFVASRMADNGVPQALAMLDFAQATVNGVDPFTSGINTPPRANPGSVPEHHAMWTKPFALQALGHIAVATKPM